MSNTDSTTDDVLRAQKQKQVRKHQEYRDERHSTDDDEYILKVALSDDKTTVLETPDGSRRFEDTEQFKQNIGSRWKLKKDPQDDSDAANPTPNKTQLNEDVIIGDIINALELLKSAYLDDPDEPAKGVRKNTINHLIENLSISDCLATIELTDVGGVGEKTAERLNEKNIETKLDVLSTSKDQLMGVSGVGKKTAENIKRKAGEQQKDKVFQDI